MTDETNEARRLDALVGRLREAITGLLESDDGRQTMQKLADGQGTNTADGRAWMRAAEMMRPTVCSRHPVESMRMDGCIASGQLTSKRC